MTAAQTKQLIQYGAAVGIAIVAFAIGYFVMVKPQQAKASTLNGQILSASQELIRRAAEVKDARRLSKVEVADLLDLTRAMPDQGRIADVIIELNKLAANSNVRFLSISPHGSIQASGSGPYQVLPISVDLEGGFYDLMELLYNMRQLVTVRDVNGEAKLVSHGRLFVVDKIDMQLDSGDPNRPQIKAALDLDVFMYGSAPVAPTTHGVVTTGTTTGTGSTTTAATTTTASAEVFGTPGG